MRTRAQDDDRVDCRHLALHERPPAAVVIGALIVTASGLFTFYREHRLARAAPATLPVAPAGS